MRKLYSYFLLILTLVSLSALVRPQVVKAEDCGGPVPPKPMKVWAKPGPAGGQITLYWDAAPHANRYAVAYGTMSNKYMYGADNIGGENARSYIVKSLMSGTKYFFRLAAANGCASSPFSAEVMAVSTSGTVAAASAVGVPSMAKPQAAVPSGTALALSPDVTSGRSGPVGIQKLWAKTGPRIGEVTLYWMNNENADNYHLVYGTEHGKFKYGALNIGKMNKYTVMKLVPGVEYHFALVPVVNNQAMYTTPQVMMRAMGGAEVVQTTKENLIQPQPFDTTQGKPKATTQVAPKVTQPKAQTTTGSADVMEKVVSPSPAVSTQAPESTPSSGY